MKKRRTPVPVNKETHLKLIVLLLCLALVLAFISRRCVYVPAASLGSGTEQTLPADAAPSGSRKPARGKASPQKNKAARTEQTEKSATAGQMGKSGQSEAAAKVGQSGEAEQSGTSGQALGRTEYLERPACERTEFLLVNAAGRYALLYDTAYRQAAWVAYLLTRSDVQSPGVKRGNAFRRDPEVLRRGWPSASDDDYAGGPFDRGHLLPSADRRGTAQENRTTFYFSNISPQYPALNRRVWKNLEEQVRSWAERYDSLYVVTGPELTPGLSRRPGGVGVPRRYFKAVLVFGRGRCHALAFLIPNAPQVEGGFMDYALSVDELEAALGYDFFCRLPDSLENPAESRIDRAFWR